MTSLLAQNRVDEMLQVYKKSTQLVSVGLLYSWTGDIEASVWGKDILLWYALGNGVLAVAAFQYYLQFAYGNLDLHVKYNINPTYNMVCECLWGFRCCVGLVYIQINLDSVYTP